MANVLHSNLTGLDLHESKGASSATAGQVAIATGTGSAVFGILNYTQIANTPTLGALAALSVAPVVNGGTGSTTASGARTNLGAAASGANTDITSITGSAATLTTARTIQTNLATTTAASFNGSANVAPGVTGTLPIANGGTGGTTAPTALASLGGASLTGITSGVAATAGMVGEILTSNTTGTSILTNTTVNATTLVLSAGEWEVTGVVRYVTTTAPFFTLFGGIGTTSGSVPLDPDRYLSSATTNTSDQVAIAPLKRFNLSGSTTIYLAASAIFSTGTATVNGYLTARRTR